MAAVAEAGPGALPDGPRVAAALMGAAGALQEALALEASLAASTMRAAAAAAAEREAALPEKARGKGAGLAPVMGKGTELMLKAVNASAGGSFAGATALLDPTGDALRNLLMELKQLVEANAGRRKPKLPKGTRDFLPDQMAIRERAFATIVSVFKRHGAVALDTPVFELRETLMGKYGEDSKLIYDLADQGGEILSLRYDLTVPFARYLATHQVGNIKRYHIARVYRRDQPNMNRGRFREFYQCDFDIAGSYPPMLPDAEVLKVMSEILSELDIGEFEIKLNHRKLLDSCLEISGVPASKFRPICSAVDKLDKSPWEEVRREMIEEKGLTPETADKIGTFVTFKGEPKELLAKLQAETSPFAGHTVAAETLAEMGMLFNYLEAMGALRYISFDLSLARGLDYYTGVIYEAVFTGGSNVGSIGGGGRYDNLVGMFSGKQIPAVGVSVGIERVFAIMEERERAKNAFIRSTQTEVFVASIGPNLIETRMRVCNELWTNGVKAEFMFAQSPNMQKQLAFALEAGIPLVVVLAPDELERGVVKIKDLQKHTEEEVPKSGLVGELKKRIAAMGGGLANVVVS